MEIMKYNPTSADAINYRSKSVYDDSESPADIAALLVRYSGNNPDICRQLLTEPVLKHFNQ